MIRTRDLLVFLALGGLLLGAILITLVFTHSSVLPVNYQVAAFDTTTASYTAEVAVAVDTKSDRLAALRRKLAEQTNVTAAPPEVVETISAPETIATTTDVEGEPTAVATVMLCPSTRTAATPWSGTTQLYAERENRRIFYTEIIQPSFSTTTEPERTETVAFTLPLRTVPLPIPTCIGSDVVAFTPTGAPLKNADMGSYIQASSNTLVGYTLDGFELYGGSGAPETDTCGGVFTGGVYRYYIDADRPGLLGCFVGIPVII